MKGGGSRMISCVDISRELPLKSELWTSAVWTGEMDRRYGDGFWTGDRADA